MTKQCRHGFEFLSCCNCLKDEIELLRDQRDSNLAKEVEQTQRMNAEIARLQKREKDLMDVIDSRDRALGFVPLDELRQPK